MATFTTEIKDKNGTPVEFGDTVRVILPEISFQTPEGWGDPESEFYAPQREVLATVHFRLSRGLMLKIIKAVDVDDWGDFGELKPGHCIPFKRTVWDWWKIEP